MGVTFELTGNRTGERLFVLIHGWQHSSKNLTDLKSTVRALFPDDDILEPSYASSTWSNTDLLEVCEKCVDRIDVETKVRRNHYQEIVLVGHSLGALVARKVFLIAHGEYADYQQRNSIKPSKKPWAGRIRRMVLLAGMNRGWSLFPKNKYTPWSRWLVRVAQLYLARLARRGKLVRAAHRGSPFVVNIRLDWLDLASRGVEPEMVVQIAGQRDTVVGAADHIDLIAGKSFHYLTVEGASHLALVQFDDTAEGGQREEAFRIALTEQGTLPGEADPNVPKPDLSVQRVVLLAHGIRDYGEWTEDLRNQIQARGHKAEINKHDYLPLLPFLFGIGRTAHVERLMDRYAEARAKYPRAKVSFLGHSNGTYLLASALRKYPACKLDCVAFAGSILHRGFPWREEMRTRVARLRNYVATADYVVAIFPSFFEAVRILPFNRDFGSAGHTGFIQAADFYENMYWIEGGHGAALARNHRPALVSYLVGDDPPAPAMLTDQGSAKGAGWAHKTSVLIVLVLLGAVASAFWLSAFLPFSVFGLPAGPVAVGLIVAWLFFRF